MGLGLGQVLRTFPLAAWQPEGRWAPAYLLYLGWRIAWASAPGKPAVTEQAAFLYRGQPCSRSSTRRPGSRPWVPSPPIPSPMSAILPQVLTLVPGLRGRRASLGTERLGAASARRRRGF